METFLTSLHNELQILLETRALLLLAIAAFCGSLIGLEREYAGKDAGLRTNLFISAGSCLFTLASIFAWRYVAGGVPIGDPGRIAAQIVTGVSFLGAGAIIRSGTRTKGLTTAAITWISASIGLVIGLGFPLLGCIVAVSVATITRLFGNIEKRFFPPPPPDNPS